MKYVELAKKRYEKKDNVEAQAMEQGEILKAEIDAKLSMKQAEIKRAENALNKAGKDLENARGLMTDNADSYLNALNFAQINKEDAAETLLELQTEKKFLENTLDTFAE